METKKIFYDEEETKYSVSRDGRIFNDVTGAELKGTIARNEYRSVNLSINNKPKTFMVHRLVAQAFCDNPNGYTIVDHIDRNKLNNDASNLRWVSNVENGLNIGPRKNPTKNEIVKDINLDEWKQIKDTNYYINVNGEVVNIITKKKKVNSIRNGYCRVNLDGKLYSVHRLVWETFKGEIPENMYIDHIDGDRGNNNLNNLRCVSQSENVKNTYARGRANMKPICQLDDDLNVINEFPTLAEAARSVGVTGPAIRGAINRKGKCRGYYWKDK